MYSLSSFSFSAAEILQALIVHGEALDHVLLPQRVLRQLLGEPRHIVGAVPSLRRRVEFGKDRQLLRIGFHILFSDFTATGFLTRPLAGRLYSALSLQLRCKVGYAVGKNFVADAEFRVAFGGL